MTMGPFPEYVNNSNRPIIKIQTSWKIDKRWVQTLHKRSRPMVKKHLKKQLNHIREIQMETSMSYHYKSNKIVKIIENHKTNWLVKMRSNWNPHNAVGQNINKCNHFGELFGIISQNCTLSPDSFTATYLYNQQKCVCVHQKTCTRRWQHYS